MTSGPRRKIVFITEEEAQIEYEALSQQYPSGALSVEKEGDEWVIRIRLV